MVPRRMQVMLEVLQDEVRPVAAPLDGTVIPHLHLEASPGAEEAAPEPALTGASGHPAEPPAGQSRPGPGQDDARRPWARVRAGCLARALQPPRERVPADRRSR
jgi:hypothetical protein